MLSLYGEATDTRPVVWIQAKVVYEESVASLL